MDPSGNQKTEITTRFAFNNFRTCFFQFLLNVLKVEHTTRKMNSGLILPLMNARMAVLNRQLEMPPGFRRTLQSEVLTTNNSFNIIDLLNDSDLDEATKKLEITSISDEDDTDSDSGPEAEPSG